MNPRPKILSVDDSRMIRLILANALKSFDCEFFEASNGLEGLAAAAREKPDLIILDQNMPIMDGPEMLAKIRATPDLRDIPVMALTVNAGRGSVLRMAKMGIRDYLIIPFKEDFLIQRISRIIELKQRDDALARSKRLDQTIRLLVVDDKPVILEQIRARLSDMAWEVDGLSQTGEAVDYCSQNVPDVVLVSLSLPAHSGFTLFQMFKASAKTKNVPVFGLSVKTALEDQARAQQMGFSGIITKPIDFEDLKAKVARALNLDTSYRYFEQRDRLLIFRLPGNFNNSVFAEMSAQLRTKLSEAVDAGLAKLVIDLSRVESAQVNLIKLCLSAIQLCQELSIDHILVGSDAVREHCSHYEETKDWRFVRSTEDAVTTLENESVAVA